MPGPSGQAPRPSPCRGRRRSLRRRRPLLRLLLPALGLAVGLAAVPAAAAADITSPIVLTPQRSLVEQFGYEPAYTRNVPVFDSADRAYIRSRTSVGDSTSYVHTFQNGSWQRLEFYGALRARFPGMVSTVGAGGLRNDSIVFDRQDRAYNPLVIRMKDGTTRNVLMVSTDLCRTWTAYRLPDGEFALEHWVGHNEIDGPPFLAIWQPSTVNPAPRSKRYSLWVTKPRLEGGNLVLPPLGHVTDQCLGLTKDSGGSSFAVTVGGTTTFTWAEATPAGTTTTPQYVATYDQASGAVSAPQLVSASPSGNDIHNKPGLALDSKGYIHFVSGTHGTAVMYRRTLAPYTISLGWTAEVPVLADGFTANDGTQRGNQTYDAFVVDSKDVLHLVTRQFRRGVDPYFGGAQWGALVHQSLPPGGVWGPPTVIVVPPEAGYAVFYHKLALDHRDRLFLSLSAAGGTEREQAVARGAMLHVLGRSAPQLGKYQRRMILASEDSGASWRFATDADLAPPGEPQPQATTPSRPLRAARAATEAAWSWLQPQAMGNQLTALRMVRGGSGWAIGTHGTILRTTDGGRHWGRQDAGTTANLFGLAVMSARAAWIVGEGGLILRTSDGGTSWHVQVSGSTGTLYGIAARTGSLAWAVGESGTALVTRNGGASWSRQQPLTHEHLYAVTFVTRRRGWAVGGDGRIRTTGDGGRHWFTQRSVTHKALYGLSFADGLRGVAVGEDGTLLRTSDGGQKWKGHVPVTLKDLRAVAMTRKGGVYASGEGGTLLRSRNGGLTWEPRQLPLRGMCGALAVTENGHAWVGGEGGRPSRSLDGGRTWSAPIPGVSASLRAAAASGKKLWLAGAGGLVVRRDDLTGPFTVVPVPLAVDLNAVSASGAETWLAGKEGTVIHRGRSGSWSVAKPTDRDLAAVAALGSGRAWVAGADGTLLSTSNAGRSWTGHAVTARDIMSLAFSDALHGWAGGGAKEGEGHAFVLRTTDAGGTWQDVELPVWGRVLDVQFLDALRGWAVGEEWVRDGDVRAGVVLATTDGGLTWNVQARAPNVLDAVLMTDASRGHAFGEEGAVLSTGDGGATWEAQDIGTDASLRAAAEVAPGRTFVTGDGGVMLTDPAPAP